MFKKIFAPGNDTPGISLGLLSLRLWLGVTMLVLHGWGKLSTFHDKAAHFPDPLGVGPTASLALTVFSEFFASALLALGLFTRFAALVLAIQFGVVYYKIFNLGLKGDHSGELPFILLAGYVTLFLAGGGRFSADKIIFGKASKPKAPPAT